MRVLVVSFLRLYQHLLSPDHSFWARFLHKPPYCRFTPSCSNYAIESIETWGVLRGGRLALARVLRCHPWSCGGYDPVPPKRSSQ